MNHPADPNDQTQIKSKKLGISVSERLGLACTCGLIMYACAALFGFYIVRQSQNHAASHFGVVIGIPAMATVMFIAICVLVPNLLAVGRIRFPLNFTLPIVFSALVILLVAMFTSTGNSLILPVDQILAARIWESALVQTLVIAFQVVCLSLVATFNKEPVN